jgi:hypothetical protein
MPMLLAVCLLLLASPARAGEAERFAATLSRLLEHAGQPHFTETAEAVGLELDLPPARLRWERLELWRQALVLEGDTLWQVLFEGRARLVTGEPAAGERVRRALLLASPLPPELAALTWTARPARGLPGALGDWRRARHWAALGDVDPDNPLLLWAGARQPLCWLEFDAEGLRYLATGPAPNGRWSRQAHSGSRLHWPIGTGDPTGEALPPTRVQRLALRALADPWLQTDWELRLEATVGGARLLWLRLDPLATVDSLWRSGNRDRRPQPLLRGGGRALASSPAWIALPLEPGCDSLRLGALGHAPDRLLRVESASRSELPLRAWFPQPPAGQPPLVQELHVEGPAGFDWWSPAGPLPLQDAGEGRWRGALRIAAPRRPALVPLAADRLEGDSLLQLAWQRRAAIVTEPHSARRGGPFDYERELLARERDFLPPDPALQADQEYDSADPNRPSAAPPGREPLRQEAEAARRWRREDAHTELRAARQALEQLLGAPPAPLLLVETRNPEQGRQSELRRLLALGTPAEWPAQLEEGRLSDPAPHRRLARIEALARQWWPPEGPLAAPDEPGQPAPRWLRWGLARHCALLVLEDLGRVEEAADLRRDALNRELDRFRGKGRPFWQQLMHEEPPPLWSLAMGERAGGLWRSASVQEDLAWRFALLLEHMRWRLRDPQSLDDRDHRLWLRLLRETEPAGEGSGGALAFFRDVSEAWLDAAGLREASGWPREAGGFAAWLQAELRQVDVPRLQLSLGEALIDGQPRLLLEVRREDDGEDPLTLPLWLQFGSQSRLQLLVVRSGVERFLLDGDPAMLSGWQAAPLASLIARIH